MVTDELMTKSTAVPPPQLIECYTHQPTRDTANSLRNASVPCNIAFKTPIVAEEDRVDIVEGQHQ